MSAAAGIVGVRGTFGEIAPSAPPPTRAASARTLVLFVALCGYGIVRWATMLANPPVWRLLGLIGLATAVAALGPALRARQTPVRAAGIVAIVIAGLAMIPMSGLPLAWAVHARIAVNARAIGDGLSTLPGVFVPYHGGDPWTRAVIALGGGMLMLGAALTLASSQRPVGEARLAGAALPLLVLATVPTALAVPKVPVLHGFILFALLTGFVFSERLDRPRGLGAAALVATAALGAVVIAPIVGAHRPWVSFTTLASRLGGGAERFNWSQTYGQLRWPQEGTPVLTVRARFASYWKAENLDAFDGTAWVEAPTADASELAGIAPQNLRRWVQTLTVTLRDMRTNQVIAAGLAGHPTDAGVQPGASPGTWVSPNPLVPGQTYQVTVYSPEPNRAELAATTADYPEPVAAQDLRIGLPAAGGRAASEVAFSPYGSAGRIQALKGAAALTQAAALQASPYAPIFATAEALKADTATPYEYVEAVLGYLAEGFRYNQDPPASRLPLVSFLLGNRSGYCQQFAGAMALLLRMGGVPARVAVGFTSGSHDGRSGTYVVSDIDAHAWVEAWFSGYGWVGLDPTPTADPALGGNGSRNGAGLQPAHDGQTGTTPNRAARAGDAATAGRRPGSHRRSSSASGLWIGLLVALALAVATGLVRLGARRRAGDGPDRRIAELERAFARCGRPLEEGVTLAALERRFADAPQAAAYLAQLRLARYADVPLAAGRPERRALRHRLADGLGPLGRIRALLALPPRAANRAR